MIVFLIVVHYETTCKSTYTGTEATGSSINVQVSDIDYALNYLTFLM